MKKLILSALVAALALGSADAQSKLGLSSRWMLRNYKEAHSGTLSHDSRLRSFTQKSGNLPGEVSDAFVTIADGFSRTDLEEAGATVMSVMGNIAIVSLPTSAVEDFAQLPCVKSMNLGRPMKAKMNAARRDAGVDEIHAGTGLPRAYTGKGVVTGIVDQGFDPHHINFRNADGSSRVKLVSLMRINMAGTAITPTFFSDDPGIVADYPLSDFTTDNSSAYHGTHTLGIMAGGYTGPVTMAVDNGDGTSHNEDADNPYYGCAPESDILIACTTETGINDSYIANGVAQILDYSSAMQVPAVVNLSLGSNTGPHDARAQMNAFLDYCSEETGGIICVSAGNEGDIPLHIAHTFTADGEELKTLILPTVEEEGLENVRYGQAYIYSDSEEEFELQAVVVNTRRLNGTIVMRLSAGTDYETAVQHTSLTKYLSGTITLQRMIDPDTGRYYVMTDYYVDNTSDNDGRYQIGFIIKGKKDQHVDFWCDGMFAVPDDFGLEGWTKGTTDGTISDMACGTEVISVGAYNTKNEWPSLDGRVYNYKELFPLGDISLFSSYGTLNDGRRLPFVCAPGAAIVSSTSHYYTDQLKSNPGVEMLYQARLTEKNRTNYWQREQGTSMSTPFVAGAIATWLEADPTLTVGAIKEIITSTAVNDDNVANSGNPVQWGAGKFSAIGGLKEVIRRSQSGIEGITSGESSPRPVLTSDDGRRFNIFLGGSKKLTAELFSMTGARVLEATSQSDELTLDATGIEAGVYVLRINGAHATKITVK